MVVARAWGVVCVVSAALILLSILLPLPPLVWVLRWMACAGGAVACAALGFMTAVVCVFTIALLA